MIEFTFDDEEINEEKYNAALDRLKARIISEQKAGRAQRARAMEAEHKLNKVLLLMAEWESAGGPRSEVHRLFGPQELSVEFAVNEIRNVAG